MMDRHCCGGQYLDGVQFPAKTTHTRRRSA